MTESTQATPDAVALAFREMAEADPERFLNNGCTDFCQECGIALNGTMHNDNCPWLRRKQKRDALKKAWEDERHRLQQLVLCVRAALKEMEGGVEAAYEKGKAHGFHEGNNFRFMQDAEEDADESPEGDPLMLAKAHLRDDAVRIEQLEAKVKALNAERARAVARMEELKNGSRLTNEIGRDHRTIDACLKALKGDQA